jgi:hypothetical protein
MGAAPALTSARARFCLRMIAALTPFPLPALRAFLPTLWGG